MEVNPTVQRPWEPLYPETIRPQSPLSPFFFTCEHASNHLPSEFSIDDLELPWLETHWAWDPGAAMVTRAMCSYFGAGAVLARASRLVCDVNRQITAPGYVRTTVDGHQLSFNKGLDEDEITRRTERYYLPYHQTLNDRLQDRLGEGDPPILVAMHSFTPKLGEQIREMEIAVVYDSQCPDIAETFIEAFRAQGLTVGVNEPYSGIRGEMYSAWHHGRGAGIDYLELEMRQDFFENSAKAQFMTKAVRVALSALL